MTDTLYCMNIYPKGTPDTEKHKHFCKDAVKFRGSFMNEDNVKEDGEFPGISLDHDLNTVDIIKLNKTKSKAWAKNIHAKNFKGDKKYAFDVYQIVYRIYIHPIHTPQVNWEDEEYFHQDCLIDGVHLIHEQATEMANIIYKEMFKSDSNLCIKIIPVAVD